MNNLFLKYVKDFCKQYKLNINNFYVDDNFKDSNDLSLIYNGEFIMSFEKNHNNKTIIGISFEWRDFKILQEKKNFVKSMVGNNYIKYTCKLTNK